MWHIASTDFKFLCYNISAFGKRGVKKLSKINRPNIGLFKKTPLKNLQGDKRLEILNLLSKYSVDCVATAVVSAIALFLIKQRATFNEKINRLLPFLTSFLVYLVASLFNIITHEEVISKSMTAGGLSTVLYAFCGGYSLTKEEELKRLMQTILKTVVVEDEIVKITEEIMQGLKNERDEKLIIIKISDLIRANLCVEASEERINAVTTIFVKAYQNLQRKR